MFNISFRQIYLGAKIFDCLSSFISKQDNLHVVATKRLITSTYENKIKFSNLKSLSEKFLFLNKLFFRFKYYKKYRTIINILSAIS